MAKALAAHGHEVQVLTGFPNYPGGRVYPGYHVQPWKKEIIDGISVLRVPLFPSHDKSALRRIANYSSFASSSLIGALLGVKRPDVVWAYNLVTLAPTLKVLKAVYDCAVVFDVQDLWPESVYASGMLNLPRAQQPLKTMCNWAYGVADIVLGAITGYKTNTR